MKKEIERKYLLGYLPTGMKILKSQVIHQTYLAIGEEEIRVRKVITSGKTSFFITMKCGIGLVREEYEKEITEKTYEQLLMSSQKTPLVKYRYMIESCGFHCEIDIYVNSHHLDLKVVEIEFDSEEEAKAFVKPEWLSTELTGDKCYKNQILWKEIQ
ncbi:adenylate cyclase [Brevibacillus sp. NPDC058079]|uniref:adenylate cyclase n=1 Tax=Brevibacillus sp. NPDC058079 TaxID=3346330 RepID=UPI0036DFB70A